MKDIYEELMDRENKFRKGKVYQYYAFEGIIDNKFCIDQYYSAKKPVAYPQEFTLIKFIKYFTILISL